MSWLTSQKTKIVNKIKSDYKEAHHSLLRMQIPLTNTERLENYIKLGLWLVLGIILFLLINLDWFTLAGLYSTVMVTIFWLKGWNPIASKIARYWQKKSKIKGILIAKSTHISRSNVAEQRLLNILTITTNWQSLSPTDRSSKALRALDAIYHIAVGTNMSPTTTSVAIADKALASVTTTGSVTTEADAVVEANNDTEKESSNKDVG